MVTEIRSTHRTTGITVSVLVPAKDEAENLPLFMEQMAAVVQGAAVAYEVVVVDDGSVDDTWSVLERLTERYDFLRIVRHRSRRGIADALRTGYLYALGEIFVFYPGRPAVQARRTFPRSRPRPILGKEGRTWVTGLSGREEYGQGLSSPAV